MNNVNNLAGINTGLPKSGSTNAGVLITSKVGPLPGYWYQLYHSYEGYDVYKRPTGKAKDGKIVWADYWKKIAMKNITTEVDNEFNLTPKDHEYGFSYQEFLDNESDGAPVEQGGTLVTYKGNKHVNFSYQTFKRYDSNEIYIRHAKSADDWHS